jgi:putative SOS response-associated peptidase YedK
MSAATAPKSSFRLVIPHYNIAPGLQVPVVLRRLGQQTEAAQLRWGLVPSQVSSGYVSWLRPGLTRRSCQAPNGLLHSLHPLPARSAVG